ncbi:hypothetical protein BLA29_015100, partial [Euroglyphus maynei]
MITRFSTLIEAAPFEPVATSLRTVPLIEDALATTAALVADKLPAVPLTAAPLVEEQLPVVPLTAAPLVEEQLPAA